MEINEWAVPLLPLTRLPLQKGSESTTDKCVCLRIYSDSPLQFISRTHATCKHQSDYVEIKTAYLDRQSLHDAC